MHNHIKNFLVPRKEVITQDCILSQTHINTESDKETLLLNRGFDAAQLESIFALF